jgi:hypothetical protein
MEPGHQSPKARSAVTAVVLGRLRRLLQRTVRKPEAPTATASAVLPPATLTDSLEGAGITVADWLRRRRGRRVFYSTVDARALETIRARHPERVSQTIAAATRIIAHEFDLLGSGPFLARDTDRPERDGYAPIDWYLDPVRRLRFPRGIPHKQWNLFEMRPGNADIKYPWELGRCQHWPVLGQAFALTRDDRFALEIARELDDFVEANPTGIGVNWTCTMDVGLRAVSWAMALELAHECAALDDRFWGRAYEALFDHGVFIRNNLENTYEVTSNHFLSNLLGLQFVAPLFDQLEAGREWESFARTAIEHEMDVQVLPDGADYESSIPYHRLVAELFLGAARLADHLGSPMPETYRTRVRSMVAFLADVTRPDGLMPQIGDADDGRLHILGGYAAASPQDGRHLFGPAASMFAEPSWLALGGEAAAWEAAWWGYDASSSSAPPSGPRAGTRLFPHAGLMVARTEADDYLLVSNGIVGTNGFGNHKHNDQLSFEYHRNGRPLIVDPGSYVYTSDGEARNRFRGTASHNTLGIDGVEQNDMRPDWLFRLFETAKAEHVSFDAESGSVEYVGRHHGYERLDAPITHERTFQFSKASGDLTIVDRLIGRGRHDVKWHFHLGPGTRATKSADGHVALAVADRQWTLRLPPGLEVQIEAADYSPSYGVKVPCVAVNARTTTVIDGEQRWQFSITS